MTKMCVANLVSDRETKFQAKPIHDLNVIFC